MGKLVLAYTVAALLGAEQVRLLLRFLPRRRASRADPHRFRTSPRSAVKLDCLVFGLWWMTMLLAPSFGENRVVAALLVVTTLAFCLASIGARTGSVRLTATGLEVADRLFGVRVVPYATIKSVAFHPSTDDEPVHGLWAHDGAGEPELCLDVYERTEQLCAELCARCGLDAARVRAERDPAAEHGAVLKYAFLFALSLALMWGAVNASAGETGYPGVIPARIDGR